MTSSSLIIISVVIPVVLATQAFSFPRHYSVDAGFLISMVVRMAAYVIPKNTPPAKLPIPDRSAKSIDPKSFSLFF